MRIDAHHHLWDLTAVHYPWLMADGQVRFFGDPAPIQRNYLLPEFRASADAAGFQGSVHIQVGADNGYAEAKWVDRVVQDNPDWPMVQVAFCDLCAADRESRLNDLEALPSVRGVRQIVGRAPGEDAKSGSNALLLSDEFHRGLQSVSDRGLSFDLQLIPELIAKTTAILQDLPDLRVALCHAGSPHDRSVEGIKRWRHELSALAGLPNVVCKISGLGMFDHDWTVDRFRPLVETCIELFGPNRCMIGSNFPVDSLSSDYATLMDGFRCLTAEYSEADTDQIFGQTALDFYQFAK